MASVQLDHLSKIFADGTHALSDCCLRIDDGELLVVVGPSGCGKSTLLRLVAGLETPSSGEIRIADRVVNDASPQQRNVAMVFQDYALYPFMTVRQNLEFPLRMRRLPAAALHEQAERAAALLGIGELLERLPKQLSGGQRQRVAMGRALVREPAVSLLDEPLSNLDAKLRVQVRAEIADLQQRTHTTMIYVTHDQVEAMTLGQRVAVLDKGRLQQIAPPRELYDHPANAFVAGFIGSPPMNLLAAQIDGTRLRLAGSVLPVPPTNARGAVTVGIRPEALHLQEKDALAIQVQVEHVEYLGHETLVHARTRAVDAARVVARLSGMHPFTKDQSLALSVAPEDIHLFGQDGAAL